MCENFDSMTKRAARKHLPSSRYYPKSLHRKKGWIFPFFTVLNPQLDISYPFATGWTEKGRREKSARGCLERDRIDRTVEMCSNHRANRSMPALVLPLNFPLEKNQTNLVIMVMTNCLVCKLL